MGESVPDVMLVCKRFGLLKVAERDGFIRVDEGNWERQLLAAAELLLPNSTTTHTLNYFSSTSPGFLVWVREKLVLVVSSKSSFWTTEFSRTEGLASTTRQMTAIPCSPSPRKERKFL